MTPTYVSGDTNGDGYLQPTETWVYEATGTSIFGAYSNTGTVTASRHRRRRPRPDHHRIRHVGLPRMGPADQHQQDHKGFDGAIPATVVFIHAGNAVTWRYEVTKTHGTGILGNIVVTDSDASVTPMPVLGPDGVHNIGDADGSGTLNMTEVWVFEASGIARTGDYANTGTATGTCTDTAGHTRNTTATDDSSYFGSDPTIDLTKTGSVDRRRRRRLRGRRRHHHLHVRHHEHGQCAAARVSRSTTRCSVVRSLCPDHDRWPRAPR